MVYKVKDYLCIKNKVQLRNYRNVFTINQIEVLKMDVTKLNKLSYIFYSESNVETVKLVKSINSEDELFVLLDNYNWDNGFEGRIKDFFKVDDAELGNTWYHHQDGKTLQEMDSAIQIRFTYRGVISILKLGGK